MAHRQLQRAGDPKARGRDDRAGACATAGPSFNAGGAPGRADDRTGLQTRAGHGFEGDARPPHPLHLHRPPALPHQHQHRQPPQQTIGAELVRRDAFLLWCAEFRAAAVDAALADAGGDVAPLTAYTFSRRELTREQANRRAAETEAGASSGGGTYVNLPAAVDSKAAMACSRATNDGPVVCWEFPLRAYPAVETALRNRSVINPQHHRRSREAAAAGLFPPTTLRALTRSAATVPSHEVDERLDALPPVLLDALYPFQLEGVKFGLARGGRCLIADEMGVGKTIQALAVAACYLDEGPLLVVVPASMRLAWARELERWLPELQPRNLHVITSSFDKFALEHVKRATETRRALGTNAEDGNGMNAPSQRGVSFSSRSTAVPPGACPSGWLDDDAFLDGAESDEGDEEAFLERVATQVAMRTQRAAAAAAALPRVVVTSFHMAERLSGEIGAVPWGAVIVDESHTLRTTLGRSEVKQTEAVLDVIRKARRAVLATGSPSLTRPFDIFNQVDAVCPGVLGANKRDFAANYCELKYVPVGSGDGRMAMCPDASGGSRLLELNALLRHTVMVRRLKRDVLSELPPKRRQVVPVYCGDGAKRRWARGICPEDDEDEDEEDVDEDDEVEGVGLSRAHKVALDKLPGVCEWLRDHALRAEGDAVADDADAPRSQVVIFAHHRDVMDAIQRQVLEKLPLVPPRGRCSTPPPPLDASLPPGERSNAAAAAAAASASPPPMNPAGGRLPAYIRIDGASSSEERTEAVDRFHADPRCRAALVSVTAGGVGLDLSCASIVVFAELPPDAALVEQAEDRVHRRGQLGSVNVYFLVGHGPGARADEWRWAAIERSLDRVRQAMNAEKAVDAKGLRADAFGTAAMLPEREVVTRGGTVGHASEHRFGTEPHGEEGGDEDEEEGDFELPPAPEDLWFELSSHTGRVHLHAASDGSSPLRQSVAPNDVLRVAAAVRAAAAADRRGQNRRRLPRAIATSDAADDDVLRHCERLKGDPGAILAAAAFVEEVQALHPGDRNRLSQGHVPARSPVAETVASMTWSAGASHAAVAGEPVGGWKGSRSRHGRDRRVPLPAGAEWRPVAVRCGRGGRAVEARLEPVSLEGVPLCLLCMAPRVSTSASASKSASTSASHARGPVVDAAAGGLLRRAKERRDAFPASAPAPEKVVPPPPPHPHPNSNSNSDRQQQQQQRQRASFLHEAADRPGTVLSGVADLFCSRRCADVDLQARNASSLRRALYARERGVCRVCGLDAAALVRRIAVMRSRAARRRAILEACPAFGERGGGALLEQLCRTAWEGHAWHFDHVLAVRDGGGQCTVENGRTLCVLCHKKHTKEQRARWAAEARAKKEGGGALKRRRRAAEAKENVHLHSGEDPEDGRVLDILDPPLETGTNDGPPPTGSGGLRSVGGILGDDVVDVVEDEDDSEGAAVGAEGERPRSPLSTSDSDSDDSRSLENAGLFGGGDTIAREVRARTSRDIS